jgi:hypothetical protein
VTGSKGEFITDIAGTHFRVRVEGKSEVGGHTTAESPVTITLD